MMSISIVRKLYKPLHKQKFMAVCDNCHAYKVFGNKCWFYWEHKKSCSQFKRTPEDEPHFHGEELIQITH